MTITDDTIYETLEGFIARVEITQISAADSARLQVSTRDTALIRIDDNDSKQARATIMTFLLQLHTLTIDLVVGFNTDSFNVTEDVGTVTGQLSVGILGGTITEREVNFTISFCKKVLVLARLRFYIKKLNLLANPELYTWPRDSILHEITI